MRDAKRRLKSTVAQTSRTRNWTGCKVISVFRAGDRAGLNQEGIEMKKLLLAGVALAALSGSGVAGDLARPAYAPPPPVYLDGSLLGRERRLQLGPCQGRSDPARSRHVLGIAEGRWRHRRLPVGLQQSVRPMGLGL